MHGDSGCSIVHCTGRVGYLNAVFQSSHHIDLREGACGVGLSKRALAPDHNTTEIDADLVIACTLVSDDLD